LESLRSVKKLWFEGRLEAGLSIPEPVELDEYSGKFVLRITRGLHKSLQREARRQGVSLNQYIGQTLAERHKPINLEHIVRDAISKCFTRADASCAPVLAFWNPGDAAARIPAVVSGVSITHERFTETFAALVGERQRKTYRLVLGREPYAETNWSGDATKKTKARSHHC